jgi:hypothetical protein
VRAFDNWNPTAVRVAHKETARIGCSLHHLVPARAGKRTAVRPSISTKASSADDVSRSSRPFEWHKQWYPVSPVQDLAADMPNKLTLLGMDFVVWFHRPSSR